MGWYFRVRWTEALLDKIVQAMIMIGMSHLEDFTFSYNFQSFNTTQFFYLYLHNTSISRFSSSRQLIESGIMHHRHQS